jgi:hypothetical protein
MFAVHIIQVLIYNLIVLFKSEFTIGFAGAETAHYTSAVHPASPLIYVRQPTHSKLSFLGRALALLISSACLGVLVVATRINPAATGLGTHQQLRLQPCQFEIRTGLPCPTCGMTTSFAHFVRGNWAASFYVQPMGMLLAIISGMCFWAGLYIALSGRPAHRLLAIIPGRYYLFPLMAITVFAWAWKIWIHVNGQDGW